MKMKRVLAWILLAAVLLGAMCGCQSKEKQVAELLVLGERHLGELDYEQALIAFLGVIEIDPMEPRGYLGAAEAYVGLGDSPSAIDVLERGLRQVQDAAMAELLAALRISVEDGAAGGDSAAPPAAGAVGGGFQPDAKQAEMLDGLYGAIDARDHLSVYNVLASAEYFQLYQDVLASSSTMLTAGDEKEISVWFDSANGGSVQISMGASPYEGETGTHAIVFYHFNPDTPFGFMMFSCEIVDGIAEGAFKKVTLSEDENGQPSYMEVAAGNAVGGLLHGDVLTEQYASDMAYQGTLKQSYEYGLEQPLGTTSENGKPHHIYASYVDGGMSFSRSVDSPDWNVIHTTAFASPANPEEARAARAGAAAP